MRQPKCDACLWVSPTLGFKCDELGFRCENVTRSEKVKPRKYRSETACESCYQPTDQPPWNICSECEAKHPAPEFVRAYKGHQDENPTLSVTDHLAAAEAKDPGITNRLTERTETHQRLADRIAAFRAQYQKPAERDIIDRLNEIRTTRGLSPLEGPETFSDARARTVPAAHVIRLKQIASLQVSRSKSVTMPPHLHPSLVRDLVRKEQNLSPQEAKLVEHWRSEFELSRREKARSDA